VIKSAAGKVSWPGVLVLLVGAALAVITVMVAIHTPPNALASGLLQAFTFIVALIGAYIFAKPVAEAAAKDVIAAHARSAFRRQIGLYRGLGRLIDEIDSQAAEADDDNAKLRLKILRAMIVEQVGMSGDALSDWRDLVPEEVAQLEQSSDLIDKKAVLWPILQRLRLGVM
jgi:hypothetical protein